MAEAKNGIPPEDDFNGLACLAWDLAHEANEDYDAYQRYQSEVDKEVERFGAEYTLNGSWYGKDIVESRNRAKTKFEIKSEMAALVMRHPKCPFNTEDMRKFQEDIISNRGNINWGLASSQTRAVMNDYNEGKIIIKNK